MLLEVKDLYASYDAVEALHGVSCQLNRGETVALIGANGAGKTTLLTTVVRLLPPFAAKVTAGDILFEQQSLLRSTAHEVVKRCHLALVPEGRHIFGDLTVLQNLQLGAYTESQSTLTATRLAQVFAMFPRLAERQRQRSELLSGGEQQMLAIGRALMSGCTTLLLDEPSMGLAPLLVQELFQKLAELKKSGMTIFLVEQNAHLAMQLADRVYIMENGAIVHSGTPRELDDNRQIKQAYLGM